MKKIIHKGIKKDNDNRYLCNQAVGVTVGKYSMLWKKVNCKNCLQIRKRGIE